MTAHLRTLGIAVVLPLLLLATPALGLVAVPVPALPRLPVDLTALPVCVNVDVPNNCEAWSAHYDGPSHGDDAAYQVMATSTGLAIAAGTSRGTSFDFALVAYKATGEQAWSARFDSGFDDILDGAGVSPDGKRVFVTGEHTVSISAPNVANILGYSALDGSLLWSATSTGSVRDLAVSADGTRVVMTGGERVMALDATTGAVLWSTSSLPNKTFTESVGISPDGTRVVVTGPTLDSSFDYGTVGLDAATGAVLWAVRYDAGNQNDFPFVVAMDPMGQRAYVTGFSEVNGNADVLTIAYDMKTGAQDWRVRYDGPQHLYDEGRAIAASPDGTTVYVTGGGIQAHTIPQPFLGNVDIVTIAYDAATGAQKWLTKYNSLTDGFDISWGVAVSPDSKRVYVAGDSYMGETYLTAQSDAVTLAYDASNGAQVWGARYDDLSDTPFRGSEGGNSVAVSPDGQHVYTAGTSQGANGDSDFLVVAYHG